MEMELVVGARHHLRAAGFSDGLLGELHFAGYSCELVVQLHAAGLADVLLCHVRDPVAREELVQALRVMDGSADLIYYRILEDFGSYDDDDDEDSPPPVALAPRDEIAGTGWGARSFVAHLRRCGLPVVGLLAASAAVDGLAGGTVSSPSAALGLLGLLLGGVSLFTLHMLRA